MCQGNHLSDLTRDSHTQQIEQPKKVAKVSLLYLGQNIKSYTSYGLRVELEILQKTHSARLSIDQASQNCTLNSTVNLIPTLHKRHTLSKSKTRLTICFDHGLPTIQIRVLIH